MKTKIRVIAIIALPFVLIGAMQLRHSKDDKEKVLSFKEEIMKEAQRLTPQKEAWLQNERHLRGDMSLTEIREYLQKVRIVDLRSELPYLKSLNGKMDEYSFLEGEFSGELFLDSAPDKALNVKMSVELDRERVVVAYDFMMEVSEEGQRVEERGERVDIFFRTIEGPSVFVKFDSLSRYYLHLYYVKDTDYFIGNFYSRYRPVGVVRLDRI